MPGWGLSLIGAIGVPINAAYKEEEGAFILESCAARVLLTHHALLEVAQKMCGDSQTIGKLMVSGEGGRSSPEFLDFSRELQKCPPLAEPEEVTPQDISMLMFTSGTTGKPKGVMVTHEMYVAAGQGYATWVEADSEDRFFTCLPLCHANAQYYSTMGSLAVGASLIMEERFSASKFWDQVRRSGATVVNFIGMMLPVLLKQPHVEFNPPNQVRVCYGSPAFSPEFLTEFEKRFSTKVVIGFALTECMFGTIERLGQSHRPRSSGVPRWHPDSRFVNELRIVGEQDVPLPSGEVGEILLRNPAVTPGYWQNDEQTTEALRGGWLHTGDLGRVDEEGHLYFVDRKKDVIRRRGENIASSEVEEVLKREPRILDCAVIGVPSELAEEEVKVFVVLRPGEQMGPEEIVSWCAERLAHFKVPPICGIPRRASQDAQPAGTQEFASPGRCGAGGGMLRSGESGYPSALGTVGCRGKEPNFWPRRESNRSPWNPLPSRWATPKMSVGFWATVVRNAISCFFPDVTFVRAAPRRDLKRFGSAKRAVS